MNKINETIQCYDSKANDNIDAVIIEIKLAINKSLYKKDLITQEMYIYLQTFLALGLQ